MKRVLLTVFTCCTLIITTNSFAGNEGVGLGSLVFSGKKGKLFEILAVTTNGTFYTSTFAITSGTSGYKEGIVIGVNVIESYIADNMDNVANDIAKGNGEYLDALAYLMKVTDKDTFKNKLHQNFNKIYTSKDITSKEVVLNILNVQNNQI